MARTCGRGARWVVGAWLAAGALLPGAAVAQSIEGVVTDASTGQPIRGAMVRAEGDAGEELARFLTGEDGRFRLLVGAPGTYRLHVERIGLAAFTSDPVGLSGTEAVFVPLMVAARPVELDGVTVSGVGRGCSIDPERGGWIQGVWTEARKSLDATRWTEREGGLRFELLRRERTLDAAGDAVLSETTDTRTALGNPVRTLDAEDLAAGGYVREDEDGFLSYYGPDATVLLSDDFLETHCFSTANDDEARPGFVTLAFEPVPGRRVTDVEGVIRLDSATLELDHVVFRYTGLDDLPGDDRAGGEVRFTQLDDGRWVVRAWFIRMPVLELREIRDSRGRVRGRPIVAALRESGSTVLDVEGGASSLEAVSAVGSLGGVVWDSVAGRPLAGAILVLPWSDGGLRADARGQWSLSGVAPGTYLVGFRHPAADSVRYQPPFHAVTVTAGAHSEVSLAIPRLTSVLAQGCAAEAAAADDVSSTERRSTIVGLVLDDDDRPVPGIEVRAVTGLIPGDSVPRAITDERGAYRLCGLAPGLELGVEARVGPYRTAPRSVGTAAETVSRLDFRIGATGADGAGARADADGDSASPVRFLVQGTVVRADDLQPVDGVLVELVDPAGATTAQMLTDALGRFVLEAGAEVSSVRLRARHLAYRTVESEPMAPTGRERRVQLRMADYAIPLDEVLVEVRGTVRHLEQNGYYRREVQGLGTFLDRAAIEDMLVSDPTDVLARIPSLTPLPTSGAVAGVGRVFVFRGRASGLFGDCPPSIYVDGALRRQGGNRSTSLDDLVNLASIEAIEVYASPSRTPIQFTGPGSACGALVVWTRQGGPGG